MVHSPDILVPKWMVPLCGVFKINWDAPIDTTRKMMSVDIIVKDHERQVMAAMC